MFELEVLGSPVLTFESSAQADNALGQVAATGREAWLYMGDTVLAYTSEGSVTNRNGQALVLSVPIWLGFSLCGNYYP